MSTETIKQSTRWLNEASVNIGVLQELCNRKTDPATVPQAADIVHEIPVYEGDCVRQAAAVGADGKVEAPERARALQEEWAQVLLSGAGVVAIRNAFQDISVLDQVTEVFQSIIKREAESDSGADHFAPAGSNTRIWNAHEKLCMEAPELFAFYNANDALTMMCRAWLGPGYQITAQANIVHPGGKAQHCHRDYHMGFQQPEHLYQYPAHVHAMSPMLTLQGAIAHSDMPLESGPTKLLPFSQNFLPGYLATAREDCVACFEQRHVQLPLQKGDMVFFNPALMHAAGDNKTADQHRFANLVQVSSAYGRSMELLDRAGMCTALYPLLLSLRESTDWNEHQSLQVIEACAEGYAFPANMELEPPINGLAPESQQDLMKNCLAQSVPANLFADRIRAQQALKRSH